MKINIYLNFDGDCEQAFRFYADLLGGELTALHRFRGTPAGEHVPEAVRDKVMHAALSIDGQILMGSDAAPPEHPYEGISGAHVSLHPATPAEAERLFEALAAGGRTVMPLGRTFWAERFGMCVDRYGVPWMINCEGNANEG